MMMMMISLAGDTPHASSFRSHVCVKMLPNWSSKLAWFDCLGVWWSEIDTIGCLVLKLGENMRSDSVEMLWHESFPFRIDLILDG